MKKNRQKIISRIAKQSWVHKATHFLGLYLIGNIFLKKLPVYKYLKAKEIILRLDSIAALALSEEILGDDGYTPCLKNYKVSTFIDLGCNIGWFPCILASFSTNSNLKGIMIDPDTDVLESARWHIQRNNLTECFILQGAVGCPGEQREVSFNITGSNTQSSIRDFSLKHPYPLKGKTRIISVPCISVEKAWKEKFQDQQVDLLKIDIEGSELDFLKSEIKFVSSSTRRVVCEWHSWHVNYQELEDIFLANGFSKGIITEQDEKGGIVFFDNIMILSNIDANQSAIL